MEWSFKGKKMKYITIKLLVFIPLFLLISCSKQNNVEISEKSIINKLSQKDYYKKFYKYNIRTREPNSIFMIETEFIKEIWIEYSDGEVEITDRGKDDFDKIMEFRYPENTEKYKVQMIKELQEIITFMVKNNIESVVRLGERIDWGVSNGNIISRYNVIDNSVKEKPNILIYSDNWIIIYNKNIKDSL
jgi:hypothetical protein